MKTIHTFEHGGKRYRFVHDERHETVGSYAYETPEETKAAEEEEIAKLASGEWVVLGCVVSEPCDHESHCRACDGWTETDSLWGIVVPNAVKEFERFALEAM